MIIYLLTGPWNIISETGIMHLDLNTGYEGVQLIPFSHMPCS